MKILIIHQSYYPEMSGTARRAKELAESFVKNGHTVNVLTSTPRAFRSFPDYEFKLLEVFNNVNIYRVNTFFEVNRNVFFRILSYASFFIRSLRKAIKLSHKSDIIISIAPLSSGLIGAVCQKVTKKHHHFDVPDMLPDLGIAAGMLKNKLLISFLYKVEKWVYNNSSTISGCTKGHVKAIKNKNITTKDIYWIPDWIDENFFNTNAEIFISEVKKKYNFNDKKLISFVGNIGALQKPDVFIEVMRLMQEEGYDELLFLFIGDGIMLRDLKFLVKKYHLNNVKFVGKVKREYVPSLMKISTVLVTNYVPNKHLDLYIPGKLFEYAISKKPIIMGSNGDAKDFINKFKLGIAVPPSNINKFKESILAVANDSFKFNPDIKSFISLYSISHVTSLYNNIFNKIKFDD